MKSLALANLMKNNEQWQGWAYQENLSAVLITETNTLCEANNVQFQLVFIPTPKELDADYDIESFCTNLCKDQAIPLINTLADFDLAKSKIFP